MNKTKEEEPLLYYTYTDGKGICYSLCIQEVHDILCSVTNGHDAKKVYLINPLMLRIDDEGHSIPSFTINSIDGIQNRYQADIEPELLNKLCVILAKSCINLAMKPIGVLADVNPIKFLCYDSKQSEIIAKTFVDYAKFDENKSFTLN